MFGVSHGNAGKGDKTRVTNHKAYLDNLAAVNFPNDDTGFERKDGVLIKRYGPPPPTTLGEAAAGFVH